MGHGSNVASGGSPSNTVMSNLGGGSAPDMPAGTNGDVAPDDDSLSLPDGTTAGGSMPGGMDPKYRATDFKKNDLIEFATKHQLGPARKGMMRERKSH